MALESGAYGFRLVAPALEAGLPDLVPLGGDAPEVTVVWRHASMAIDREQVEAESVCVGARQGSGFEALREPLSIALDLPYEVSPEALVHPLLTVPISVLARWRGDVTLHAGAFAAEGAAWGVVGAREAGKSTMLASLGRRGVPVVADDLLAVLDGVAWSGPACVDLRPDAAEHIDGARYLGEVGRRPRYRLSTPPSPAKLPLRGLFLLGWNDGAAVEDHLLNAKDRLELLYRQEYIGLLGPADPQRILDLMALPAWRVTRPRDWGATDSVCDRILKLCADYS